MKSQRAYAGHVLECIRRAREDSADGRETVFASRTLQDAILRNLQVLCEPTQRIDECYRRKQSGVDWKSIAGMRNVLVHDYFDVDFEAVWRIVDRDLEPLSQAVRAILAEIDEPAQP